tara:strand:- start:49 stop:510 length:462 start_codon:yes stop_codon:yes gene_type:complete
MKKFKHTILVIFLSCLMFACSKMKVIESNNMHRTIKWTNYSGVSKIINQKFNSDYNTWISAECANKDYSFTECPNNEIVYSKFGKLQIRLMKDDPIKTSENNTQSRNSEDSSNGEEDDNSNEEETSNNEEQYNFDPEIPHHPPIECEGGPEFC